jgi:predicted amidophosphoribosyltransferase
LTDDRCPVCQARFRGVRTCSRCGADLTRTMVLVSEAWRLREEARAAVALGEFDRGYQLAARAQEAKQTRAGESLRTLCEWLRAATVV